MSFSFTLPEKNWKLCEAENLTALSDIYAERDVVYSLSIWRWILSQVTQRPVQAQLSEAVLRSCRAVLLEKLLYLPKPCCEKKFSGPTCHGWPPQGTPPRPHLQGFAVILVQLSPSPWDPSPSMDHFWRNSCLPFSKVQEIWFIVLGPVTDLTEKL